MAITDKEVLEVNETHLDEELTFKDCMKFIRRNFRLLLSGVLAGGVLGMVTAVIVPSQWEGRALIRVGQLTIAAGAGSLIKNPVESPLQVADRVKSYSFQNEVLKSLHIPISDDELAKEFHDSLKVKLEKSDLIQLSVRGYSPGQARIYAEAVVNVLKNIHERTYMPSLEQIHENLASNTLQLKEAHLELNRMTKLLNEMSISLNEKNFPQVALLNTTVYEKTQMINYLSGIQNAIEVSLHPENTYGTDVLGGFEVSEKPIFPNKPLFVFKGVFIGLLLALIISQLQFFKREKLS